MQFKVIIINIFDFVIVVKKEYLKVSLASFTDAAMSYCHLVTC